MKYVLVAIFVLFAVQPSQAGVCDMPDGQGAPHGQHANMSDDAMHHDSGQEMDCCDDEPEDQGHSCGSMTHCGSCAAGLVAVSPSVFTAFFNSDTGLQPLTTDEPLSTFSSPPFRPPIS